MEIGKVPSELLDELIHDINLTNTKDVLLGSGLGQDCGILDFGDWACSISSDPITGSGSRQGYLGVHVSCNDIAASGALPIGVVLTVLMPKDSTKFDIKQIMDDAKEAAGELHVSIVGGHTEVTEAVNRPVISVTAIGKLEKDHVMYPHNVRAGDKLVLTKYAGLEGSAILARDCREYLLNYLDEDTVNKASKMFKSISVLKEAQIARTFEVIYMHDVTEGGVLGAVWEIAEAARKGIIVDKSKVLVENETKDICRVLDIDFLKLISSGSMLMVMRQDQAERFVTTLQHEGIPSSIVGEVTDGTEKLYIENGNKIVIEAPKADHLFKAFQKVDQA